MFTHAGRVYRAFRSTYRTCGAAFMFCSRANTGLARSEVDGSGKLSNPGASCSGCRRFANSKASAGTFVAENDKFHAVTLSLEDRSSWSGGSFCSDFSMRFSCRINKRARTAILSCRESFTAFRNVARWYDFLYWASTDQPNRGIQSVDEDKPLV